MHLLPLLAAATLLAAASCSSDCSENRNALPLAGFYVTDSATRQISVSGLRVEGVGAPGDSLLFDGASAVSQLYLPCRIDSDETVYRFSAQGAASLAGSEVSSTVTFRYSRRAKFVSRECGVSYVYTLEDVSCSGQLIDSVVPLTDEITNVNEENMRIYFSPSALDMQ